MTTAQRVVKAKVSVRTGQAAVRGLGSGRSLGGFATETVPQNRVSPRWNTLLSGWHCNRETPAAADLINDLVLPSPSHMRFQ